MTKTLGFILSASLAACAGQADVRYSAGASTPELVALDTDPSVMVVANADEPVFFSENTYWLYRNYHWYRSASNRGGWARIDQPPEHVRRIERPTAYVHYRHDTGARTTQNERARGEQARPEVREQSEAMPAEAVQPRPDPRPDAARGPSKEPNSQGPGQPYANPLPPQQVPPATPGQHDGPAHQIVPDPDRAPVTPGMSRSGDQRPATDRDRSDRSPGQAAAAPVNPARVGALPASR